MANFYEVNTCCSLIEIGDFSNVDSKESILTDWEYFIKDNYWSAWSEEFVEIPKSFFAVTRTKDQPRIEKLLKEFGFRSKLMPSRHSDKGFPLKFWYKNSLPRDFKKIITKATKEILNDLD